MFPGVGAISIGSSLLGGIFGHLDAKKAEREQRRLLGLAVGRYDTAIEGLRSAAQGGQQYVDRALQMSLSLEKDGLAGYDEVLSNAIGRTLRDREVARAQTRASMTQRGLGNSTIQDQVLAGGDAMVANSLGDMSAAFAENRASLQGAYRQVGIQGLMGAADYGFGTEQAIAQMYARSGDIYGQTQVVPPQTGQNIAAIGSNLVNNMFMSQMIDNAFQ